MEKGLKEDVSAAKKGGSHDILTPSIGCAYLIAWLSSGGYSPIADCPSAAAWQVGRVSENTAFTMSVLGEFIPLSY